jgi:hypothetical protein
VSVFKSIFVPSCKIAIKWPRLRVIDKRLYAKQFTYECVQAKKHVCAGGGEGEGGRDSLGERPLYDGTEEAGFACSAPSSLFDAPTDGSRAVEGEQGCSGEVRGERV